MTGRIANDGDTIRRWVRDLPWGSGGWKTTMEPEAGEAQWQRVAIAIELYKRA